MACNCTDYKRVVPNGYEFGLSQCSLSPSRMTTKHQYLHRGMVIKLPLEDEALGTVYGCADLRFSRNCCPNVFSDPRMTQSGVTPPQLE